MKYASVVILISFLANLTYARIIRVNSLEWLSCHAEVIVIGKITDIAKRPNGFKNYTVEVEEVIKGDHKNSVVEFNVRLTHSYDQGLDIFPLNQRYLLFLSISKDHGSSHQYLDSQYVPTTLFNPLSILNLTNPRQNILDKDFEFIEGNDELLKIARNWSKAIYTNYIEERVHFSKQIEKGFGGRGACFIIVPAEEKFRSGFLELAQSDNPRDRAKAASELGKFPGDETVRVLRELLEDDTEFERYYSADMISDIRFGVRAAAYHSLQSLGEEVGEIPLKRLPTEEERIKVRHDYWRGSFSRALFEGWVVTHIEDLHTEGKRKQVFASFIVTCSREVEEIQFTFIPNEWFLSPNDWTEGYKATGVLLGIYGYGNQGGYRIYVDDEIPKELMEKLINYYDLK